jgi:secreted trypsin-like serine protease
MAPQYLVKTANVAAILLLATFMNGLCSRISQSEEYRLRGNDEFDNAALRFFRKENRKIMGGVDASPGMFPWQASLQNGDVDDPVSAHYCGGSIYNQRWIITAAHCLTALEAKDVKVIVGTWRLTKNAPRRRIQQTFLHPSYDPDTRENDVGLILLAAPIVFDTETQPIELLTPEIEPALLKSGTQLRVTGWGLKDYGGTKVALLQWAKVPYVDRSECSRTLSWGSRIKDSMVCAGGNKNDACTYDSGGPLAVRNTQNRSLLAGIVSWGGNCSDVLQYGVYARVATAVAWVKVCTTAPQKCNKKPI